MYRRRVQGWMKHMDFLIQEIICFQIAFCLACVIRHGWINPYGSVLYRNTAIIAALIQVFLIISLNVFKSILWRGYYREFVNSIKTVAVVMLMLVFYLFLIQRIFPIQIVAAIIIRYINLIERHCRNRKFSFFHFV